MWRVPAITTRLTLRLWLQRHVRETHWTHARDAQRRNATQRFVPELMQIVMRAGSDGMTLALAGRTMAAKEGFTRTLREQRMTFRQFVDLNADTFRLQIRGNASKSFVTPEAAARTRQRPDGTLMQFQRLRRIT